MISPYGYEYRYSTTLLYKPNVKAITKSNINFRIVKAKFMLKSVYKAISRCRKYISLLSSSNCASLWHIFYLTFFSNILISFFFYKTPLLSQFMFTWIKWIVLYIYHIITCIQTQIISKTIIVNQHLFLYI